MAALQNFRTSADPALPSPEPLEPPRSRLEIDSEDYMARVYRAPPC